LHPEKCPSNHQKLRWKYGIEDKSANRKEKTVSIATFQQYYNQVLFNKIKFDTNSKKYGHDDTIGVRDKPAKMQSKSSKPS
jgi:hypothetical protein